MRALEVIDRRKNASPALRAAWSDYVTYRHQRYLGEIKPRLMRDLSLNYADSILRKLRHLSDDEAVQSLRRSIERNWIGVWPIREPGKIDRVNVKPIPLTAEEMRWRP